MIVERYKRKKKSKIKFIFIVILISSIIGVILILLNKPDNQIILENEVSLNAESQQIIKNTNEDNTQSYNQVDDNGLEIIPLDKVMTK